MIICLVTSFKPLCCALLQCPAHTTSTDLVIAYQVKFVQLELAKRTPQTRCIQLESRIFVPCFDLDWEVIYGEVTLVFRLQNQVLYRIVNPISALASSLRSGGQVPKRKVRGFSICSRTNCGKSAFSFRFRSETSKMNSEIQLPLFDFGTEVPKRIVKSWVWLLTIRFGLATTTEWRKSTRTQQLCI